jgi:hypothetical protein
MKYLPWLLIFVISAVTTKRMITDFFDSHAITCIEAAVIQGHAECVKYEKVLK